MIEMLKLRLKNFVGKFGFELRPITSIPEATPEDLAILEMVKPFTMTSLESLWSTMTAVRHVTRNRVEGSFVECGVWRGGQAALAARVFQGEGDFRDLWLYDTFAGMTAPTKEDVNLFGVSSDRTYQKSQKGDVNMWAYASVSDVQKTLRDTGYPDDKLVFVEGPVESTLRTRPLPDKIAILRLDTDWYESTKAELEILFPRLVPGGILIVDDYGHYLGARQAVDEFFSASQKYPLLHRIDYSGRLYMNL